MEGRTKYNYGTKGNILDIKALTYMLSVTSSNISDEEKAYELYSFCNYDTLFQNYLLLKELNINLKLKEKIKYLLTIYEDYEKRGLFNVFKNPYKCTLEEINVRVQKINQVYAIFNAKNSDYEKAEQLLKLFPNSQTFYKSYSLFYRYGLGDERLKEAKDALNHFEELVAKFQKLENDGIISSINYLNKELEYLPNYEYAKFVILSYINDNNSYKLSDFFHTLGINEDIFKFALETIDELDYDLYKKYLEKKELNKKIRFQKNKETILDLAQGITTGYLNDGTPFDLIEFIKRVPFKYHNFISTLYAFMEKNTPLEYPIIQKYIFDNKIHRPNFFAPLNVKELYLVKTTIKGHELTKEDLDKILEYMRLSKIPLINKTYIIIRNKYLDGEITLNDIDTLRNSVKETPSLTLIPRLKKR